jgi:hypothetical protein
VPRRDLGPGNPFPEYGPEFTGVDSYNYDTVYARGTIVYKSFVTDPMIQYFRCTQEKCAASPPGNGWEHAGWE